MQGPTQQITLPVEGMGCGGCAAKVEKLLRQVDGVQEAAVSFPRRAAVVEYDPQQTDRDALVAALATGGYEVPESGLSGTPAG